MGKLRVNKVEMGDHHFHSCSSSGRGSAGGGGRRGGALRTERKTIEKNRRNLLKSLYAKLYSLLPHHCSQEGLPLPDQIDEAVKYIKSLQSKLEKLEKEKQSLLRGRKRNLLKSPQMVTHELGHGIRDVLICGSHSPSVFYDVIHKLQEGGGDVIYGNYSISGMSNIHVYNNEQKRMTCKIEEPLFSTIGAAKACESTEEMNQNEADEQLQLWDFEILTNTWEVMIP